MNYNIASIPNLNEEVSDLMSGITKTKVKRFSGVEYTLPDFKYNDQLYHVSFSFSESLMIATIKDYATDTTERFVVEMSLSDFASEDLTDTTIQQDLMKHVTGLDKPLVRHFVGSSETIRSNIEDLLNNVADFDESSVDDQVKQNVSVANYLYNYIAGKEKTDVTLNYATYVSHIRNVIDYSEVINRVVPSAYAYEQLKNCGRIFDGMLSALFISFIALQKELDKNGLLQGLREA